MKKLITLIMAALMLFTFASCEDVTTESIKLYAPDGAPAIVAAPIYERGKVGLKQVESIVVSGATEIQAAVVNGEADVAVLPLNLAAILYNKECGYKLLSVNVFGNLYMVAKNDLTDMNALKGKVVYNIGKNATPDITFKYILENKGIEYVESETPVDGKVALAYKSAGSEIIPLIAADEIEYGILGEPAVSNCNAIAKTKVVLDIQAEWKKITGNDYTQAGVIVSDELAADKDFIEALKLKLKNSKSFCTSNIDTIKELLQNNGVKSVSKVNMSVELIEKCSIGYVSASDAKANVEAYFNVLKSFNAKLIGGKLPNEGFYL